MSTLCNAGAGGPLHALQAWAFERLIMLDLTSGDLRWAIVALLSRWFAAAVNPLVENILRRGFQGARFGGAVTTADTMVAAGGR